MNKIIEIGARIKQERQRLNMAQEIFAGIGRVTKETQIKYEKGTRKANIEYLNNLQIFGIDVVYILTGDKNVQTLNTEEGDVVAKWREASIPTKAAALAVLNSYTNPADAQINNTVGDNSSNNLQIGGSFNGDIIHKPSQIHITNEQKQVLKKLVQKIVKKSKTGLAFNYHTVWGALNKHCGVSSYGLIEFDDYHKAESYLTQQLNSL